jgi:hypothetical protein
MGDEVGQAAHRLQRLDEIVGRGGRELLQRRVRALELGRQVTQPLLGRPRSVRSRVTFAKPSSSPSSSRTAVMSTSAQNSVPSLRTRQPCSAKLPSRAARRSSSPGWSRARSGSV